MNDLSADHLRTVLRSCLAVPRWIDEVADQAPFASLDDLLEAAKDAATPLSADEVEQALADHPRIGERAEGSGAAERFSRSEQASGDADDEELAAAIAAGNRAYEERFGRIFLIRAAGRSRAEIFSELARRLELDDEEELAIVAGELRDIALLRIAASFRAGADAAQDKAGS
jgi:2-oxo-4-hydroxy-4-carboxy-5-ureidoimidazoline decarboxylase